MASSSSISTLQERLLKRTAAANKRIVARFRKEVSTVMEELVESTAVDTGESRSNWRITGGAPNPAVYPPFARLPKGTDTSKFAERRNAMAAIILGKADLASITDEQILRGTPVYVQNHHWVTAALDNGTISSFQQPAGFVAVAIQSARAAARQSGKR